MQEIIAYGAAAEPQAFLEGLQGARAYARKTFYSARDRFRWRMGNLSGLDYRNYQDAASINRGDQAIVDAIVLKLHERDRSLSFRRVNWQRQDGISPSAALVAVCGGGYLFVDKHAQLAPRIQTDLDVFSKIATPVVLFGVGINQIMAADNTPASSLSESASHMLSRLLERVDLISVRDWTTQSILQRYTAKPVHMVADPALYLAKPKPAERPMREQLKIGINFPLHGPASNMLVRRNFPRYVALLQRMRSALRCEFVYMVHYAAEKVVARLLQDAGIALTIVEGQPQQLVETYADLDLHLGGMLHSCILSASAGTPCVGLAYDLKHSGFFNVLGLPEQCISAFDFDVDQAFELLREACARREELREKILATRLQHERSFDDFTNRALALMAERRPNLLSNT